MNIKRILYPTDLSACSLAALDYAATLASSFEAELHVLYVDDLRDLVALAAYTAPGFAASSATIELKERLLTIKPTLTDLRCAYHYAEGIPADKICTFVENEQIDLVVMSSHGRTGLSRVFLGSVAELVLRKAKCPVLVVKQSPERGSDVLGQSASAQSPAADLTAVTTTGAPVDVGPPSA